MYSFLASLPRPVKAGLLLSTDLMAVAFAYYLALVLRLNSLWPEEYLYSGLGLLAVLMAGSIILTLVLKLHMIKLAHYEKRNEFKITIWAVSLVALGVVANQLLGSVAPRTVPIIFGLLAITLAAGVRLAGKTVLKLLQDREIRRVPVAIYGAGSGGLQLLAALEKSCDMRPVFFVDDNPALQRLTMAGLRVRSFDELSVQVAAGRVKQVLLAMPSASDDKRRDLLARLTKLEVKVKQLPSYAAVLSAGNVVKSLNEVTPDDLLGRDKVELDLPAISETYQARSVLVSGAGGSIGSELARQIVMAKARKLVLFDHSEYALYAIERELRPQADALGVELIPVLGSVTDATRVSSVLKTHEVDIVLHAAAYKHVPLVEMNETAGVFNNVLGTRVMAEAARNYGVRRFILVSTDKAVRPTNVMGASKRLAELVIQDLQTRSPAMVFSMVRFGNVLDSSGSVIPLFREQIAAGGPITLTHQDVTRYFMTIPEAARLVLMAGSFADGGEVFVLEMRQPVRIRDLARRMVELSGLTVRDAANPDGDIALRVTGLRPGEKLYEELLINAETLTTPHPKILRAQEARLSEIELARMLRDLSSAIAASDDKAVRAIINLWVDGYHVADAAVTPDRCQWPRDQFKSAG